MTDFIEAIAPLRSPPAREPQPRKPARKWCTSTWMHVPMLGFSGSGEFDG